MRKSVSVIIKNDEGQILILRRKSARFWSIPGGIVERNESTNDAAIREVKEETGISIEIESFVGEYNRPQSPNGGDTVYLFTAKHISGEMRPCEREISKLTWTSIDRLPYFKNPYMSSYLHDSESYDGISVSRVITISKVSEYIGKLLFLAQDIENSIKAIGTIAKTQTH